MGDMADMVTDSHWADSDLCDLEDYFITTPIRYRLSGEDKCPICGKDTVLREGKFGKFYGCSTFPKCKGSRNYK